MQFSSVSLAAKGLLVLALAKDVTAFWRMPCLSRSGIARMDPLVSPGKVGGHVHAIHGSSGFSLSSGTPELLAGDCTSCQVAEDKSAYWTPAVYFKHAATGEFQLVQQVGGMLAYYLLYTNPGETTVEPFPENFAMIAGDTFQRNFSYPVPDVDKSSWQYTAPYNTQAFLRQAALGFNCLDYQSTPEASLFRHSLPDKAYLDAHCKDGVRFELMFPSCWNGDATAPDQKSHVAYPDQVMTGNCPSSHPRRLVSLFFETIWNTYEFAGVDGQFVISNGDLTGNGYHGDFIMGWEEDLLSAAVKTCTNPSGQISDCPLFTIQDSSVYGSCNFTEPLSVSVENILSPIGSLPGNILISTGPEYAKPVKAASVLKPTTTSKLPGVVFAAASSSSEPKVDSTTTTSSTTTTTSKVTTPPPAPTPTVSYYSTQYVTSGQVVNEILWIEDVVTVTAEVTTTIGVEARDHLHKHRRANHHH